MNKFSEKSNSTDLFAVMIPGLICASLLGVSLVTIFYEQWNALGNGKYIVFFVLAYLFGLLLQEIGTIMDEKYLYRRLYGGNPREIFLLKWEHSRLYPDELTFLNAYKAKDYLSSFLGLEDVEETNEDKQKRQNSLMFSYCQHICEMNGLSGKFDKMMMASDMSRSLYWGCILMAVLNLVIIGCSMALSRFSWRVFLLYFELPLLLVAARIFLLRKRDMNSSQFMPWCADF